MQIQRLLVPTYSKKQVQNSSKVDKVNTYKMTTPSDISFQARVDKGLVRFYEVNKERMPRTVRLYIEKLPDKSVISPNRAQANAFAALAGATTITSILTAYPEEELFVDLKDPEESKATRGILSVLRENKDLFELYNKSILANNENLTVWLIKKIFLEAKTIEEINKDFITEMDEDFKSLYFLKEDSETPIKHSTLKSLGIKMPEFEYQQSLRYTREGYSDFVGDKISQAQRDFYASLPPEERTARAKKSVENFETWWNSLGRDKQLDMIAEQIDELEMLRLFNSSEQGKTKTSKKNSNLEVDTNKIRKVKTSGVEKVKVESTLSRDELFKIWAGNNLKAFQESLTNFDKEKIATKRAQICVDRWLTMSPEERTEYINRLRTTTEPLRYAMIDAWNKNSDILVELSYNLKKNHVEKPIEILYGTSEFNEHLSQVMSAFWASHPDFGEKLGVAIKESHEKIKTAINNGNFELLKREIINNKVKREKEVAEAVKNYREVLSEEILSSYSDVMKNFINAYKASLNFDLKYLPSKYLKDYFDETAEYLLPEIIESCTKFLRKEELSEQDLANITKAKNFESVVIKPYNRSLETAIADVLYTCTAAPEVYQFSVEEAKKALGQVVNGDDSIRVYCNCSEKDFEIPIVDKNIDIKLLDRNYNKYSQDIDSSYVDGIINQFVKFNYQNLLDKSKSMDVIHLHMLQKNIIDQVAEYIKEYRFSGKMFYNDSNVTPDIKENFAKKFFKDMPKDIDTSIFDFLIKTKKDFIKETRLFNIQKQLEKKYNFLPKSAFEMFSYELLRVMRNVSELELYKIEKNYSLSTKIPNVIIMNRDNFTIDHLLYALCVEQALADALYKCTGDERVYALQLEELLNEIESLVHVKRFPFKEIMTIKCHNLTEIFDVTLKHRIQPYELQQGILNYRNELADYINNEALKNNGKLSKQELVYILNPDESNSKIDDMTLLRINNSLPEDFFK